MRIFTYPTPRPAQEMLCVADDKRCLCPRCFQVREERLLAAEVARHTNLCEGWRTRGSDTAQLRLLGRERHQLCYIEDFNEVWCTCPAGKK